MPFVSRVLLSLNEAKKEQPGRELLSYRVLRRRVGRSGGDAAGGARAYCEGLPSGQCNLRYKGASSANAT